MWGESVLSLDITMVYTAYGTALGAAVKVLLNPGFGLVDMAGRHHPGIVHRQDVDALGDHGSGGAHRYAGIDVHEADAHVGAEVLRDRLVATLYHLDDVARILPARLQLSSQGRHRACKGRGVDDG